MKKSRLLTVVLLADGEADVGREESQGEDEGDSAAAHHPGRCVSSSSSQND